MIWKDVNCDNHKPKRKCAIAGCKNMVASRGQCPKCGGKLYRNVCVGVSCPRKKRRNNNNFLFNRYDASRS